MFFEMSKLHYNKWEVSQLLEVVVNSLLEVFALRYGWIFTFIFGVAPNQRQYEIIIGNFLACICLDFVIMLLRSMKEVGAM